MTRRNKRKANALRNGISIIVLILVWSLFAHPSTVHAQANDELWSTPYLLYDASGRLDRFALTSDNTGRVHAFWIHNIEERSQLFHSSLDNGIWSVPNDILFANSIRYPSAVVDPFGEIHVVWSDGGRLYYSSAGIESSHSAAGWAEPAVLADAVMAHIRTDSEGMLHIAYTDPRTSSIYLISSEDSGKGWNRPQLVSTVVNGDSIPLFVRLAITPSGYLHVVWDEMESPDAWPPYGLYHAWSTDKGKTWQVRDVAGQAYIEGNVVAVDDNNVHLVWNGRAGYSGRFHQWTEDGGITWTEPQAFIPVEMGGGSTDPPGLVVDSANKLHAVTNTNPTGNPGDDATTYSNWVDGIWSQPIDIAGETPGYVGLINEYSQIEVSNGNLLHVLYVDDDETRLWYRQRTVDAPKIEPIPFFERAISQRHPTESEGIQHEELSNRHSAEDTPVSDARIGSTESSEAPTDITNSERPNNMLPNQLGIMIPFASTAFLVIMTIFIHFVRRQR